MTIAEIIDLAYRQANVPSGEINRGTSSVFNQAHKRLVRDIQETDSNNFMIRVESDLVAGQREYELPLPNGSVGSKTYGIISPERVEVKYDWMNEFLSVNETDYESIRSYSLEYMLKDKTDRKPVYIKHSKPSMIELLPPPQKSVAGGIVVWGQGTPFDIDVSDNINYSSNDLLIDEYYHDLLATCMAYYIYKSSHGVISKEAQMAKEVYEQEFDEFIRDSRPSQKAVFGYVARRR